MSYFKETVTAPIIKVLPTCVPLVVINPNALVKMQLYVDNNTEEVGWLGTAYKEKNTIYIDDVYLFEQEVHSTTTEINADVLSKFGEELLQQPNGMDIWNAIKVWGHSHVNMAVSPSGQDDKQMITFAEGGHDWFVRIIANKKTNFRVDLYDYAQGIIYNDTPWEEALSQEEQSIYNEIEALEKMLSQIKKNRVTKYEVSIKAEIASKVKKKTYGTVYGTAWNRNTQTTPTTSTTTNSTKVTTIEEKKTQNGATINVLNGRKVNLTDDIIDSTADIYTYFDKASLLELGDCKYRMEVMDTLDTLGYEGTFTYTDVTKIWDEAKEVVNREYVKIAQDYTK